MGDEEHGDAQLLLDGANLGPHLHAQGGVQVGQGLVQQEDLGPQDQRPGQGHPLLLAAGYLVDASPGEVLHAHDLEHLPGARLRLSFADPLELEPVGHVPLDVEMGEEGVVLEDGGDGAALGRQGGDVLAVHAHAAGIGDEKAAHHAQGRGLAAARGPQQADQLATVCPEVEVADDGLFAEGLGKACELEEHG